MFRLPGLLRLLSHDAESHRRGRDASDDVVTCKIVYLHIMGPFFASCHFSGMDIDMLPMVVATNQRPSVHARSNQKNSAYVSSKRATLPMLCRRLAADASCVKLN